MSKLVEGNAARVFRISRSDRRDHVIRKEEAMPAEQSSAILATLRRWFTEAGAARDTPMPATASWPTVHAS